MIFKSDIFAVRFNILLEETYLSFFICFNSRKCKFPYINSVRIYI